MFLSFPSFPTYRFMSIRIIFSLFLCIAIVRAQLVQFQQPFSGQQVSNGDTVLLIWTIIGQQAGM